MFSALIVEDNAGDARNVERLIKEYDVTVAADLAEALSTLSDLTFDVILLDLSLPDSFGLGTLARIDAASGTTPIVVLTGQEDASLGAELIRSGAQDYLPKSELNAVILKRVIHHAVERKRIVADLVSARDHMRRFTHHVAHDLKGPLARISGFARLLQEDMADDVLDALPGHLAAIERQVESMDRLIERLMQLARSGYADFRSEPIPLNDVFDRAASAVFAEKVTPIRFQRDELPTVRGDEDWLFSLFANLLQNTALHAGEGARVRVHHEMSGDMVRVRFVDDGVGIAREEFPTIFKPFTQLHGGAKGHGLGLSLCRNIVERHGGDLTAEPGDAGHGVAFVFTLPGLAS